MKRYDMKAEYNRYACADEVIPVESADGDWIKFKDYQAATEATKATGTAGELPEPSGHIRLSNVTLEYTADQMREYGNACAETARHDKDGNHADDLRGMLDELQAEFDKQQSAFWACSEKLAQVQRNQETELSDMRILELAEEDFGEQDDRNVKNEALLSFARKVQAARQPAPVEKCPCGFDKRGCEHYNREGDCTYDHSAQVTRINTGYGNYLEFERKTTGKSGWLVKSESGDLVRALNPTEVLLVDSALAATAAPVLSDEQIDKISEDQKIWRWMTPDGRTCIDITRNFARAILAATKEKA